MSGKVVKHVQRNKLISCFLSLNVSYETTSNGLFMQTRTSFDDSLVQQLMEKFSSAAWSAPPDHRSLYLSYSKLQLVKAPTMNEFIALGSICFIEAISQRELKAMERDRKVSKSITIGERKIYEKISFRLIYGGICLSAGKSSSRGCRYAESADEWNKLNFCHFLSSRNVQIIPNHD